MDKSFDVLRKKVLQAVEEQKSRPKTANERNHYVFSQYIYARLAELQMAPEKLAQLTGLSADQTGLLLQGDFSESLLTDEVLVHIAQALECDLSILAIFLRRQTPTTSPSSGDESNFIVQ